MDTDTTYVFLDFDGVTHPWGEVEDFRCLPLIEEVIRCHDEARIVITSDWRTLFSLQKLAARFASDIRPRIAGVTPHMLPKKGSDLHGLREREARKWLEQRHPQGARWLAIDDAPGNWLTRSRLILTDFKRGFTEEDASAMSRLLARLRDGTDGFEEHPLRAALWA
ncbi:MAG: hypothetical protein KDG55_17580 [Rhodocyclaceae bacterium]|nr:hypothetical protein [Rhodocyclaceae bacterium]